jgi:NADPH:quinone reductase-like Zn-dependent oxidoreductase
MVEDVSLDPPGPGELLIKIKATGLCHSDLSVVNGDRAEADADGFRPRSGRRRPGMRRRRDGPETGR